MKTGIKYINIALKYIGLLYYKIGSHPFWEGRTSGYSAAGIILGVFFFINPILIIQYFNFFNILNNKLLFNILFSINCGIYIYIYIYKEYWKKYADEYEASCEEEQKKVDRRLKYLFGGLIGLTGISFYLLGLSRPD